MCAHKDMKSFNLSSLFISTQGVTVNKIFQERASKLLFTKMISFISRFQDKSSEVVESNIQRNPRGIYSSNINAICDTSSFRTSCIKLPDSNPKTPQKVSFFNGRR